MPTIEEQRAAELEKRKEQMLNTPSSKLRNKGTKDFAADLTPEEAERLSKTYSYDPYTNSADERFNLLYDPEDGPMLHEFTPAEDRFIRDNAKYLSDEAIAYALHLRKTWVTKRRRQLGIRKKTAPTDVIIWAKRDDFDKDVKELQLYTERGTDNVKRAIEESSQHISRKRNADE